MQTDPTRIYIQQMLSIAGKSAGKLCDGLARRDLLRIGALGMGGISLPRLLKAESLAGIQSSQKAVIMVYMAGAPPHQDLWDPKPDAPSEYRGDLGAIDTNLNGVRIGELLPKMAKIMDKCIAVRSVVGAPSGAHDSFMCYTGRTGSTFNKKGQPPGGWPSIGATLSRLMGAASEQIPAFVGLAPKAGHPPYGSSGKAGFLGIEYDPFKPSGQSMKDMVLNDISAARLDERKGLLNSFESMRRDIDKSGRMDGLDGFTRQAFELLTTSRLANAFNLEKEPLKVRERYGKGNAKNVGDGAPRNNEHFLLARRLVEAGVRCVTLNYGRWDFHSDNTGGMRSHAPMFDQGLSALIEDLHERGMADDVTVCAWGEFGRTPKVNNNGGRDHWPKVSCALLAGGGMKAGQVIGATDSKAAEAIERPVHMGEIMATLYHNMGIDPNTTTLPDLNGRPHYLVDAHRPMPEVI